MACVSRLYSLCANFNYRVEQHYSVSISGRFSSRVTSIVLTDAYIRVGMTCRRCGALVFSWRRLVDAPDQVSHLRFSLAQVLAAFGGRGDIVDGANLSSKMGPIDVVGTP